MSVMLARSCDLDTGHPLAYETGPLHQSRLAPRPALLVLLGLGLLGCHREKDATSSFPRAETLYIGGLKWGEPTSFNPLLSELEFPLPGADGGYNVLYEMLLLYNVQTGQVEPLLAESYKVDKDAIEVVLKPAARWNDGSPVTAWDVKYTFELGKTYKSLRLFSPLEVPARGIKVFDDQGNVVRPDLRRPSGEGNYPRRRLRAGDQAAQPAGRARRAAGYRHPSSHVLEPLFRSVHGDLDEFSKLKFDQIRWPPARIASRPTAARRSSSCATTTTGATPRCTKESCRPPYTSTIYKSNDHYSVALQQGRLRRLGLFRPADLAQAAEGGSQLVRQGAVLRLGSNPHAHPQRDAQAAHLVALEKDKIKGAVQTDFILSAEIVAITLGTVAASTFTTRLLVLAGISAVMTVGVYGLVALIVKLDDLGIHLSKKDGAAGGLGRGILAGAPWLMKGLSVAGTAAMFLVGGGILTHGIPFVHHWIEALIQGSGSVFAAIVPMLINAGVGIVAARSWWPW